MKIRVDGFSRVKFLNLMAFGLSKFKVHKYKFPSQNNYKGGVEWDTELSNYGKAIV